MMESLKNALVERVKDTFWGYFLILFLSYNWSFFVYIFKTESSKFKLDVAATQLKSGFPLLGIFLLAVILNVAYPFLALAMVWGKRFAHNKLSVLKNDQLVLKTEHNQAVDAVVENCSRSTHEVLEHYRAIFADRYNARPSRYSSWRDLHIKLESFAVIREFNGRSYLSSFSTDDADAIQKRSTQLVYVKDALSDGTFLIYSFEGDNGVIPLPDYMVENEKHEMVFTSDAELIPISVRSSQRIVATLSRVGDLAEVKIVR